jgi:hypothetical protein
MIKKHYENPKSGGSRTMCHREICRDIPTNWVTSYAYEVTCEQCADRIRKWAEAWRVRAKAAAKSSGLVVDKSNEEV